MIKQVIQESTSGGCFKAPSSATAASLRPQWGMPIDERTTTREQMHGGPAGIGPNPLPILPGQVVIKGDYQK